MKGNTQVIAALNELLSNELSAMDQYFIHSRMYHDWGLHKLFERIDHEVTDEKAHAAALIERILFLEGTPDLSKRDPLQVGTDVPSMLQNDLNVEYAVGALLKKTIALCESVQDYVTRDLLMTLLDDTENDHAHWLEQQLRLIKLIGLPNYIQSQI
ncbi:MAG: bacterioferritin [Gammaproteobacteria bacterium]|uniref:bacterioferritin n=1 Tax=Rheinheimera sp. A13L TaxID=506534 RepID=UPI0002125480|nr:bacterioferritin [Rheinheimera sp. A13L]MBU1617993.1 bacterioferritin [Gammaproteobacteria bacterium]EGM78817.1 bacterioferritin [Rheinheimera sp. A13L]MBU2059093.1 bacterioferritin [Gammaproteobacteria bacterium]MBU2173644.1 bacterioferritin [Gammaproteobacteria bacterium]MBU2246800.1 bacterioferritin [Gammaproteobacteria bacterium]